MDIQNKDIEWDRSLKLVNLQNVSIHINEQNDFHYSIQCHSKYLQNNLRFKHLHTQAQSNDKNVEQNNIKQHEHPTQLIITFDLIQIEQLSPLYPSIINLFSVNFGVDSSLKIDIKRSKLFDIDKLIYYMELQGQLISQGIKNRQISLLKVNSITNNLSLKHQICIKFNLGQKITPQDQYISTVLFGNKNSKWAFGIQNLKISIKTIKQQRQIQQNQNLFSQAHLIQNLYLLNDYSYPLVDELQLSKQKSNSQASNIALLMQKIQQTESYSSPIINPQISQKQLYICHDMKGGYLQDVKTFTPFRQKNKTHNYRYNYLSQTYIFNYFSHQRITIPPKVWRNLCKKYNVLCLGTFIVENNDAKIDQNFLTQQFALKLVYIAKKVKFDGYLINIEVSVKKPINLLNWLNFLTKQMNKTIPGSQIIWYDSVITDGRISYQNQLNNYNKPFYEASNGLFTNYWWTERSLKNSIINKIKQKPVYIGNDCFGRNTYGGGKYDIVKAINKIHEVGYNQLSIALFAPGFTYQDGGEKQRNSFNQNELKMYHTKNIISKNIQKWKNTQNGGQGWKIQNQWAVTSFDICRRQALIKITDFQEKKGSLKIHFSCYVTGTGPDFKDYYKISMQVLDYKSNIIYVEKTFPRTTSTDKQQLIQIILQIDCELITQNVCAKIIQQGKSIQYWAGHFGSRFKQEKVSLSTSDNQNAWIKSIPIQPVDLSINKSFFTIFNKGEGNNFYLLGKKLQSSYSSLSDYDCPPAFILNDVSNLQYVYNDCFLGGSCLSFRNTNKISINKFRMLTEKQLKFAVVIAVKNNKPLYLKHSNKSFNFEQRKTVAIKQTGWIIYDTTIQWIKNEDQIQIMVQFQKNEGKIGLFGINCIPQYKRLQQQSSSLDLSLKIELNKISKHAIPYFANIIVESKAAQDSNQKLKRIPQRLLIKVGNFGGFINIQRQMIQSSKQGLNNVRLKGYSKNIPILQQKVQQIQVKVYALDKAVPQIKLQEKISKKLLSDLIKNKQVSFDFNL